MYVLNGIGMPPTYSGIDKLIEHKLYSRRSRCLTALGRHVESTENMKLALVSATKYNLKRAIESHTESLKNPSS